MRGGRPDSNRYCEAHNLECSPLHHGHQDGDDRTRTSGLPADNRLLLPLSYAPVGTTDRAGGIRTHGLELMRLARTAAPPPRSVPAASPIGQWAGNSTGRARTCALAGNNRASSQLDHVGTDDATARPCATPLRPSPDKGDRRSRRQPRRPAMVASSDSPGCRAMFSMPLAYPSSLDQRPPLMHAVVSCVEGLWSPMPHHIPKKGRLKQMLYPSLHFIDVPRAFLSQAGPRFELVRLK